MLGFGGLLRDETGEIAQWVNLIPRTRGKSDGAESGLQCQCCYCKWETGRWRQRKPQTLMDQLAWNKPCKQEMLSQIRWMGRTVTQGCPLTSEQTPQHKRAHMSMHTKHTHITHIHLYPIYIYPHTHINPHYDYFLSGKGYP